jgi:hypothetical protein
MFSRSATGWALHQTIDSPAGRVLDFGYEVVMDGGWLAVASGADGVPYDGKVDLYHRDGEHWAYWGEVQSPAAGAPERFGRSIALSGGWLLVGAPQADVGASHAGVVYVYRNG